MRSPLLVGALVCMSFPAAGGEIIFIDPAREKAQGLQQPDDNPARQERLRERVLDEARVRSGREPARPGGVGDEPISPAGERSREARSYLNETPAAQPTLIIKGGTPPSDAAKVQQAARGWSAPATNAAGGNRCKTENTVGGIEGAAQGHTVIQSSTTGVTAICK